MKKKLFLFALLIPISNLLMAEDGKSIVNQFMTNWIIPAIGLLLVAGFVNQIVHNFDGLRGKNGASQSEAWTEVGKAAAFVVFGIALLYLVAQQVSSISFSI